MARGHSVHGESESEQDGSTREAPAKKRRRRRRFSCEGKSQDHREKAVLLLTDQTDCRRLKLKCDRQGMLLVCRAAPQRLITVPCSNCIRRKCPQKCVDDSDLRDTSLMSAAELVADDD